MGDGPEGDEIRVALSREGARDFLSKLAYDQPFRSRLKENPTKTLSDEFDIVMPEGTLADDVELPSEEEAQASLREWEEEDGGRHPAKPVLGYLGKWHR